MIQAYTVRRMLTIIFTMKKHPISVVYLGYLSRILRVSQYTTEIP